MPDAPYCCIFELTLVSFVLLLLFLLFQVKLFLLFCFPHLFTDKPAFHLHFFTLLLQSLLGLGSDACILHLFRSIPLSPLWIIRYLFQLDLQSRAETQLMKMPEDKITDFIIPGLFSKCHFAYRQLAVRNPFENSHPERILKIYY